MQFPKKKKGDHGVTYEKGCQLKTAPLPLAVPLGQLGVRLVIELWDFPACQHGQRNLVVCRAEIRDYEEAS